MSFLFCISLSVWCCHCYGYFIYLKAARVAFFCINQWLDCCKKPFQPRLDLFQVFKLEGSDSSYASSYLEKVNFWSWMQTYCFSYAFCILFRSERQHPRSPSRLPLSGAICVRPPPRLIGLSARHHHRVDLCDDTGCHSRCPLASVTRLQCQWVWRARFTSLHTDHDIMLAKRSAGDPSQGSPHMEHSRFQKPETRVGQDEL